MSAGEPGRLSSIGHGAAPLLAGQGLLASVLLASALAVVASGVYLPRRAARATLLLAVVLAAVTWVVGQALGEIPIGRGTDPGTGPLLMLRAAAYWPAANRVPDSPNRVPDGERRRGWQDQPGLRTASPR